MSIPKPVQDALIASGDLTPTRISSRPQKRACPTCRSACLAAVPTLMHGARWVDAWPTTTEGELNALINKRATFFVNAHGMDYRDQYDIRAESADQSGKIHTTHQCGTPSPPHPQCMDRARRNNYSTIPF